MDNRLIRAAVKYLDLSTPQIFDETEYTPEGEMYRQIYRIVNEEESVERKMFNHAFRYITISRFANSTSVILEIERKEVESLSSERVIPYCTALQYVHEKYPNVSSENITAEVSYNGLVEAGYYIGRLPGHEPYADDYDTCAGCTSQSRTPVIRMTEDEKTMERLPAAVWKA